jgi:SAM-dependent methyltransferase
MGGGRVAFALARKGFTKLVAIDFVKEFLEIADKYSKAAGFDISFKQGNALSLEFANEAFAQVIAVGVLLSHFPSMENRKKVLLEIYRILKPGGIVILNGHNIYRNRYLQTIKLIMRFVRIFGNPYQHGINDLPRLGGRSGRVDPLFFRKNKSTLHYFYPMELVAELLSVGFSIVDCNFVPIDRKPPAERCLFNDQPWIMVVCRKSKD